MSEDKQAVPARDGAVGRAQESSDRWGLRDWPPSYFALVMATGIMSIACQNFEMHVLARGLFWLNWIFYLALWGIALIRLVRFPRRMLADFLSHTHAVGFFTWVAATGVLASGCFVVVDWPEVGYVLWWATVFLWLSFIYSVFTALTVKREMPVLSRELHGGWLVSVVATQSVSVGGTLVAAHQTLWLESLHLVSLATWLAGGMLYIWMMSLIFYRYTFLVMAPADLSPPYWINMGAMAISTLAGAMLVDAAPNSALLQSLLPFVKGMTLFFWATATWWVPMLIILGIWRHGFRRVPIKYNPQYWGAVFPLGMYTVCTVRLAGAIDLPFLLAIPRVFIWIALLAWTLAALGLMRRIYQRACGDWEPSH